MREAPAESAERNRLEGTASAVLFRNEENGYTEIGRAHV